MIASDIDRRIWHNLLCWANKKNTKNRNTRRRAGLRLRQVPFPYLGRRPLGHAYACTIPLKVAPLFTKVCNLCDMLSPLVEHKPSTNSRKQKVVTHAGSQILLEICYQLCSTRISPDMNDLEIGLTDKSTVSKFADDTKLIHPVQIYNNRTDMQNSINHLHRWADSWQMRYNTDKCGVMHLTHNSHYTIIHELGNSQLKESKRSRGSSTQVPESCLPVCCSSTGGGVGGFFNF